MCATPSCYTKPARATILISFGIDPHRIVYHRVWPPLEPRFNRRAGPLGLRGIQDHFGLLSHAEPIVVLCIACIRSCAARRTHFIISIFWPSTSASEPKSHPTTILFRALYAELATRIPIGEIRPNAIEEGRPRIHSETCHRI